MKPNPNGRISLPSPAFLAMSSHPAPREAQTYRTPSNHKKALNIVGIIATLVVLASLALNIAEAFRLF